MGQIKWFLGMEVTRDRRARTISLSQAAHVKTITKCFRLEESYGISTPLDPNIVLSKSMAPDTEEGKRKMRRIPYLSGIGSLMYTSMATRPNITFAVNRLSQFGSNPGPVHWMAVKHVIRYLHGTKDVKLILSGKNHITLTGYTDSDRASNINTCRLTSGYAYALGLGTISWSSKRQPTIITFGTEAEYIASCHMTKEVLWLHKLVELLGHPQKTTVIWSDNTRSIRLTKYPSFHTRTRHIDVTLTPSLHL
jgi:hypothetical protein